MKDIKEVCFIVQARTNSERVPNKMLREFSGTTLTDIVLEKLVSIESIPNTQIYLSVYEQELKDIGKKYPINIFDRSFESANVDNGITTLFEWWDKLPYKYVVMVSGCAPLMATKTIEKFTSKFINSAHEGLFAVVEKKNYFWDIEGNMLNKWPQGQDLLNTKTVDITFEAAHTLYASRLDTIGEGKWVGTWNEPNNLQLFPMKELEAFDIDYEWQFKVGEHLYKLYNR